MNEETSNIQVEITDISEFHCFRVLLNAKGHQPECPAGMVPDAPCSCLAEGSGVRLEILFHARSLIDLIHKCNVALSEWQAQTSKELVLRISGLDEQEARRKGLIA